MVELAVELYGHRVGVISGDNYRSFDITFNPSAIATFGANSRTLSMAVPLALQPKRSLARRRRNYFAGQPLGNARRGGKTSLPGVQPKIVLAHTTTGWVRVEDGYPSTHILKPVIEKYPTMIFDEEFGSHPSGRSCSGAWCSHH